MPTKQELWEEIIKKKSFDLDREFNFITANEIKAITGAEPRILAKFDSSDELPPSFKEYGIFILPVKNKQYVLIKGKGYHNLEKMDEKPKIFKSRLPFELISSSIGVSEMQHIDYAFNSGLIENFANCGNLYLTIRGRKFSPSFDFRVDGTPSIKAQSVQVEVDAGFEGMRNIVVVEGKINTPDDFIIRQLYYPFRFWQTIVPKKRVLPIFFTFDDSTKIYRLWQYRFTDLNDYESIEFVRGGSYQIEKNLDTTFTAEDFAKLYGKIITKPIVPQADDVKKILEFPLRVSEGLNNSEGIAKYFDFDRRQSSYYREATQALGLVELKGNKYYLTEIGKTFIDLPVPARNELTARLMFELPVMHEVLMELLVKPSKEVSKGQIEKIIKSISHLTGSTLSRRAQTISAWFKWIQNSVGILKVEPGGIKL